ncbi:flavin reductase [Desulfitobacterium metallireducens]|uniref:Flavin reductase n=1 Tax=Desulfitobacterium metallireducens DSM 15288 TaxID=871968 RepID=W0EBT4_9FIRM|nr:flavin reductase [Desulfitobacterium metallireducens]AHF06536.1 flavin reductase [Desulfitobacterium metallireducens DSM 15288]
MEKQWRCTVCGYIHTGENPPETCPVCGVDASLFEEVIDSQPQGQAQVKAPRASEQLNIKSFTPEEAIRKALYKISYGLYIITAQFEEKDNGQCANTCFQITSDPARIAIGINKNNYTHELISKSGYFGVSILDQQGQEFARKFGYRSGRDVNKFEGVYTHRGETGVMLLDDVTATMEARVIGQLDAGTHTLFLADVVNGELLNEGEPMTYAYFRATK